MISLPVLHLSALLTIRAAVEQNTPTITVDLVAMIFHCSVLARFPFVTKCCTTFISVRINSTSTSNKSLQQPIATNLINYIARATSSA